MAKFQAPSFRFQVESNRDNIIDEPETSNLRSETSKQYARHKKLLSRLGIFGARYCGYRVANSHLDHLGHRPADRVFCPRQNRRRTAADLSAQQGEKMNFLVTNDTNSSPLLCGFSVISALNIS